MNLFSSKNSSFVLLWQYEARFDSFQVFFMFWGSGQIASCDSLSQKPCSNSPCLETPYKPDMSKAAPAKASIALERKTGMPVVRFRQHVPIFVVFYYVSSKNKSWRSGQTRQALSLRWRIVQMRCSFNAMAMTTCTDLFKVCSFFKFQTTIGWETVIKMPLRTIVACFLPGWINIESCWFKYRSAIFVEPLLIVTFKMFASFHFN